MTEPERLREYYIPDNFIEEGRILQGRIKIRNLAEGIVLALVSAVPAVLIISGSASMTLQGKISAVIFFCAPPFAAGVAGFNGDSLFFLIRSAKKWRKSRAAMLYNPGYGLLKGDPVETLLSRSSAMDALIERYESEVSRKIEDRAGEKLVEGRDFIFEKDEEFTSDRSAAAFSKRKAVPFESDLTGLEGEVELF